MALTRLSPIASPTPSAGAIAASVVRQVFDAPYTDTHTNSLNATDVTSTLTVASDATTRWEVGDEGDWDDTSTELFVVTAVAATSLTIRRGHMRTSKVTHAADAVLRKFPRLAIANAQDAVNDALHDGALYPDIFVVYEETFTPASPADLWYPIDARAERVIDVYQKTDSTPVDRQPLRWAPLRYADSTLLLTKRGIKIPALADTDNTIFIQWIGKPTDGELSEGALRVVRLDACARLIEWEALNRLEANQAESGDLSPGARVRTAAWFIGRRDEARRAEAGLLQQWIPAERPRPYYYRHIRV